MIYQTKHKILNLEESLRRIASWRVHNYSIVFTNGCFDLLHLGHLDYLEKASRLGDKLVIGLNADVSVKMLKGENRPIHDQETRSQMLEAMEFVDMVVIFDEETPQALVEAVSPDVMVKGGDYQVSEIAGADFVLANGGKVEIIPFLEGHSSTGVIERIRSFAED